MSLNSDKYSLKSVALALSLTPLSLALVAPLASGQEVNKDEDYRGLEEVLVTASKRGAMSAQDMASSITAFNAEKLNQLNAVDFDEFIVQVPGTNFLDNGGPGRGHELASIRGLSPVGDNTDGVVATYLDGAPRSGSNYRLFDIGEISVLRGPQGTLWGSQAIGGLISYRSNRPDPKEFGASFGTDVYSSSGDGGASYRLNGHVNMPVIEDTFALRIAGHTIDESGYVDNVFTGDNNVNEVEETSWRISALYHATDDLTLTAIYHGSDLHTDASTYFSLGLAGDREIEDIKSYLPSDQEYDLFNIIVDWDLGWASLNYTGSYWDMTNEYISVDPAVFGVPGWVADVISHVDEESWTHELRLAYSGEAQLNWIVGLYYDDLEANNVSPTVNIADPRVPGSTPVFGEGFEFSIIGGPEDRSETAVFGEVTYDFTDQWQLLVGARWFDWEIDNRQQFTFFGDNFQQATGKVGDDDLFYKAQVTYTPTEDLMFYATRSEGFRFGGFNPFVGPALNIPETFIQFDPDTLTNYEGGAKMTFFDRRMTVNTAIYFMEWEEIQTVVWNESGTFAFTSNGPDLEAKGFELEVVTQDLLFPGLYASMSYTWSDNEFQNDAVVFPNSGREPLVKKGEKLRRTPKNSWALDLGYDFALNDDVDGYVRANYWHKDSTSTESFNSNDGIIDIPAQNVVNISAGIRTGGWDVKLYVDNLDDARPLLNVEPQADDLTQAGTASSIRPRTVGLKVDYRFGQG